MATSATPAMHPVDAPSAGTGAPSDATHAHVEAPGVPAAEANTQPAELAPTTGGENTLAPEAMVDAQGRGVSWKVPTRWPQTGETSEFRVQTYRLPAVSMDGAGECVLYRFPGGGDVQANLHRWMGQFRGPDGTPESVEALQAERVVGGHPAWLIRATGTYVSQGPTMEGPEVSYPNYALLGAVVVPPGDPVFVKCTGPEVVIAKEAAAIVRFVDSLVVGADTH